MGKGPRCCITSASCLSDPPLHLGITVHATVVACAYPVQNDGHMNQIEPKWLQRKTQWSITGPALWIEGV